MANNQYNFLDYAGLSLFWNNVKSIIEENELATATSLTNLDTRVDNVESSKADKEHKHSKSQITDFPTSLPASDVYSWAKQSTKPSYSFSEITSKPTTISGYGITDALTTSNYTSYTVKKDGTGASGTWGIDITGNAATAANATYSNFFTGYNNTITVTGDADTYYPVVISTTANKKSPNIITIWKDLGSTTAPYPENHDNGSSSMLYRYDIRNYFWDGNGGYCTTLDARYMYARLVSETEMLDKGVGNFCIWLRGGGTEYNINTSWYISSTDINVYYSSTNVGSSTYPVTIAPRTDIGNEGVFNTMTIPCKVNYAATTNWATSAGSAPASDVKAWAKADTKPSYTGGEVTLTGYSKASSYSEISASDTVNQAIAKLEGALSGLEALLASI